MAVEGNVVSTRMQLKLNTGVDENGKEIIRTKTYSNVKTTAVDQSIFDVASNLGGLQEHVVQEIHRVDDAVLINL